MGVRGLQSLGVPVESVPAVARVALNLRGVPRETVRHGDALLTPGAWLDTCTVDVRLSTDPAAELPRQVVLHTGTAAVPARVRPLGVDTAPLGLAQPLPLRIGDRTLLRDPGTRRVPAGAPQAGGWLVELLISAAPTDTGPGLTIADGRMHVSGSIAGLPSAVRSAIAEVRAGLAQRPFAAPQAHRLAELGLGAQQLAAAVRAGALLKVAEGIYLAPGADDDAIERLRGLPSPFTLSQARQALDTTRRVAVPLMELLARRKLTRQLPNATHELRP